MAEIKTTFIKSKMNKDLDDRLVPKGEYRDALNVSISQTEGDDVGALHVALGNAKLIELPECNVEVIGKCIDDVRQRVYLFVTNFLDCSSSVNIQNFSGEMSTPGITSSIIELDTTNNSYSVLCSGSFLNFSLSAPIENADLIEDLLFWTDNRNQPRKININTARDDEFYYNNEDLISVAKYYPWNPISLLSDEVVSIAVISGGGGTAPSPIFWPTDIAYSTVNQGSTTGFGLVVEVNSTNPITGNLTSVNIVNAGVGYNDNDRVEIQSKEGTAVLELTVAELSTMKDTCSRQLPPSGVSVGESPNFLTVNTFKLEHSPIPLFNEISGGVFPHVCDQGELWVYNADEPGSGWQAVYEINESGGNSFFTPSLADGGWPAYNATELQADEGWSANDTYYFSLVNPYYNDEWPGDCEYLKDKFVRFAYRFLFKDKEYSIISPFTQACFQPDQYGYFLYPDQQRAYDATDVDFVQNRITEIDLIIPCPDFIDNAINKSWDNASRSMGIKAIEIIYKDDNETTLKVLDTITSAEFSNNTTDKIKYTYQSRAPYRVLPESELTRTSDKVPIKAQTQSVTGNRVVYGNYIDKHSSIESLNYQVGVGTKSSIEQIKEYYNHTVKQNRTYQAGFLLRDRYGRASDVILSSLDELATNPGTGVTYKGSTFFHPFSESTIDLITATNTWPGDEISVLINQPIPEQGPSGYPGVFKGYQRSYNAITNLYAGATPGNYPPTVVPNIYDCLGGSGTGLQIQGIVDADGYFVYTKDLPIVVNYGIGYEDGDIITIENPSTPGSGDATFVFQPSVEPNLLGFYSYAVVIKQQEQDYYNVYLPGVLNNGILSTAETSNVTATVSVFGDNINKVPKDLNDIAPTQRGFSSSVFLSYRVENVFDGGSVSNRQYYPGTNLEKVVTLGTLNDFGVTNERPSAPLRGAGTSSATQQLSGFLDNVDVGSLVTAVDNLNGNTLIDETDEVYVLSYYEDSTSAGDSKVTLNQSINTAAWVNSGTFTFNPPGTIYKSEENPLLGILATNGKIGLTRDEGMVPSLTVFETKPTFSNLNIFWETTTTGNVSELNFDVINGDIFPIATAVSDIKFDLNEVNANNTSPVDVTNLFFPLDAANIPILDPNTICTLESVVDGNGTPSSGWAIVPDFAGRFKIRNTKDRFCGFDPQLFTYTFYLKFVYNNTALNFNFTAVLSNSKPNTNYSPPAIQTGYAPDWNNGYGVPLAGVALPSSTSGGTFPSSSRVFNGNLIDNGAINNDKKRDLTLSLLSATVVGFNDIPCANNLYQLCENLNATTDYNGDQSTAGLYIGMDVKAWFWWLPVSPAQSFNINSLDRFGGPYENASIQPTTSFDAFYSGQIPDQYLYWGGLPTNNDNGTSFGAANTGLNYYGTTYKRCNDVEIELTFEAEDGEGAKSTIQSTIFRPWNNQYSC